MLNKEIIKRCRKNDRRAQKELYERHKTLLMGICLRYASDRAQAEDIYQEAFIKIFKSIHNLKNPDALVAWLKRTVVHTAIDSFHKEKKHAWLDDTDEVEVENNDYAGLLSAVDTQQLLGMISRLPDGYRMVFNLYVVDGYTHPEIGDMLGISESTSRTQLFKAKAILKKQLAVLGIKKFEKYG